LPQGKKPSRVFFSPFLTLLPSPAQPRRPFFPFLMNRRFRRFLPRTGTPGEQSPPRFRWRSSVLVGLNLYFSLKCRAFPSKVGLLLPLTVLSSVHQKRAPTSIRTFASPLLELFQTAAAASTFSLFAKSPFPSALGFLIDRRAGSSQNPLPPVDSFRKRVLCCMREGPILTRRTTFSQPSCWSFSVVYGLDRRSVFFPLLYVNYARQIYGQTSCAVPANFFFSPLLLTMQFPLPPQLCPCCNLYSCEVALDPPAASLLYPRQYGHCAIPERLGLTLRFYIPPSSPLLDLQRFSSSLQGDLPV